MGNVAPVLGALCAECRLVDDLLRDPTASKLGEEVAEAGAEAVAEAEGAKLAERDDEAVDVAEEKVNGEDLVVALLTRTSSPDRTAACVPGAGKVAAIGRTELGSMGQRGDAAVLPFV